METSKYRLFINGISWCDVDIANKKHREYIDWLRDTLGKFIQNMYLVPKN